MDAKLDDDHDIVIENNTLVFTSGTDEIRQSILERLNFFKGEWFLGLLDGTPWIQEILGKGQALTSTSTILKDRILGTQGVKTLKEFSVDINNATRQMIIEFAVQTEDDTFIRINEAIEV